MKTFRALLLGLALLWAQFVLAAHGIEHSFHADDAPCLECLVLPGFASLPAAPPVLPPAPVWPAGFCRAVPPAPSFAFLPAYQSRAPPPLQSA